MENNTLKISAEKEEEKRVDQGGYSRKEYSFNSFSRAFTLAFLKIPKPNTNQWRKITGPPEFYELTAS